ncbi:hypothetical protein ACFP81_06530 [Deinococcus lacus]|uniref:Uncharacterized protein n=1 Tax=Deinococcus lacus TaxID=392561 RepID=A0ABW1YDX8_9DEIO
MISGLFFLSLGLYLANTGQGLLGLALVVLACAFRALYRNEPEVTA